MTTEEITRSEIALLKCVRSRDYEQWLKTYGYDNPYSETAIEKYEDTFFSEHKSHSGYKKYMEKFPKGKYVSKAQCEIWEYEKKSTVRSEMIENTGLVISLVLFLALLFVPMIASGWKIGETFVLAISFAPLYYVIISITERKKKD